VCYEHAAEFLCQYALPQCGSFSFPVFPCKSMCRGKLHTLASDNSGFSLFILAYRIVFEWLNGEDFFVYLDCENYVLNCRVSIKMCS